ncbi:FAD-binding domain-containing protein [Pleurotus eryngii]|uniref:FAD-binding domain-containing protein n=1 Tax=Pleurotus eryngii TaxID=5323 RepID=A0A9P6A397_PLEER|nr:FAD-binding domain-containing protein [Pleurotus eryngii]
MAVNLFARFATLCTLAALACGLPSLEARGPDPICKQIEDSVSSASDVYYPGQIRYSQGIEHWASSSTQHAKCVVEPGTPEDVATTLQIVGSTRTPFAVKGGGHASNPGFSSTTGVHITMARFDQVDYDQASQTATIGAGLVWDDVYSALEPYAVNVVGGRVTNVGVAGFTLGGGYSWKSNQYGLTVDTVTTYELVKPDGVIVTVTHESDPDLFFALKGGFNNFGIVTKFTLKTFPQTRVWGGLITYTFPHLDAIHAATAKFSNEVIDPKASLITTYNFLLGQPGVSLLLFYDEPTPPPGIFDDFLAIPHFTKDVSARSFLSLVLASPSDATAGQRGAFHTVPLLSYSENLLKAIVNESVFWGTRLGLKSASFISYDVEPFLPTILAHGTAATAYPPVREQSFLPLNLYFAWGLTVFDSEFHDAIKTSAATIRQLAIAEGQASIVDAPHYGNYALFDTPLSDIYGANLPALQIIKSAIDPTNVMGLAGGWKL